MRFRAYAAFVGCGLIAVVAAVATPAHSDVEEGDAGLGSGRDLFERETFGGNGRTCRTCHSAESGTVSPADAVRRFETDPSDPLFLADGSDDGLGNGVTRMLQDASILMKVPLAPNVSLRQDPGARFVTLPRGIPTTLNTPALDPVLMYDGRQPNLSLQARGAIVDHAEATRLPSAIELSRIAQFQHTRPFFSSGATWQLAHQGREPGLPKGETDSERRGRTFFVDAPFAPGSPKVGICAICHSGPMLNETNEFIPVPPLGRGGRFQTVFVSELNQAGNPVIDFQFRNPDGSMRLVRSADPGRALITGDTADFVSLNLQDPDAAGSRGHGALLPRQLRQESRGCRASLRDVLPDRHRPLLRRRPAQDPDRAGPGRHRRVPQAAPMSGRPPRGDCGGFVAVSVPGSGTPLARPPSPGSRDTPLG